MESTEIDQKRHYNEIIVEYERHYDDAYSQRYREWFINRTLFDGIDFQGMRVLEAMCGAGSTTGDLRSRGAVVTGLDISEIALNRFSKKWPACTAVCASMFDSGLPDNTFDAVMIVGGLHHLHPRVNDGVREATRILKPGGYLGFVEPHAGSLFDRLRKLWYANDRLFEANEASVDIAALKKEFADQYEFVRERYIGNIAYLLVYNSMVFRVPLWLKRLYAVPLIAIEKALAPLFERPSITCNAVCLWRKKS